MAGPAGGLRAAGVNGGAGAYSSSSWTALACGRPTSSAATVSAMSIPAVTPPPLIKRPSTHHARPLGNGPSRASRSWLAQWVVARRPRSRPAAPSTKAPVQTEVTIARSRALSAQEFQHLHVLHQRIDADAAGHAQHVELRAFGHRRVRDQNEPRRRDQRLPRPSTPAAPRRPGPRRTPRRAR